MTVMSEPEVINWIHLFFSLLTFEGSVTVQFDQDHHCLKPNPIIFSESEKTTFKRKKASQAMVCKIHLQFLM